MARKPRELDRVERWMQEVITHPGGIAAGLRAPAARKHGSLTARTLGKLVAPSKALTSFERLEIYSQQYIWRLIEVLGDEFPTVRRVVGHPRFGELATAYLARHPSTSYSLGPLGAKFPRFLGREAKRLDHRAFLHDVAVLERTIEEVFDDVEEKPVAIDDLLAVPAERWAQARFRTIPALRLLALRHPVNDFVRAMRDEKPAAIPAPARSWLAVFRRDFTVWRAPLTRERYVLLRDLVAGKTLAEALEACVAVRGVDAGKVAASLQGWFREWAGDGLFAGVQGG